MILIEYCVNESYDDLGGIHSIFRAISAGHLPVSAQKPGHLPGHTLIFALGFYRFSPKARAFARAYPVICPRFLPFQPKNRPIPGIHVFV